MDRNITQERSRLENSAMTAKGNIAWINTAKAICIFLVFCFHTQYYMQVDLSNISCLYEPFFTNGFFFISGYLLLGKQWKTDLLSLSYKSWLMGKQKGNGRNLLGNIVFRISLPTILFSSFLFIPKIVLRGEKFDVNTFLHDTIYGGAIWFTCALTVAELILFLLLLIRVRKWWLYLAVSIALTFVAIYFSKDSEGLYGTRDVPWFWKGGFIATLFMSLGGIYHKYEKFLDTNKPVWIVASVLLVYIIFTSVFKTLISVSINVASLNVFGFVASMMGIYLLIEISKRLPATSWVDYVGRHTLVLYFFSGAIPNVLSIVFSQLLPCNLVAYFLISFLSFILALFITYFINHYLEFLVDLRYLLHRQAS